MTGAILITSKPMFQVYMSNGHRNDWIGRLSQPEIASYCDEQKPVTLSPERWNFRYGGIFLNSCYQLCITEMIDACSEYIRMNGRLFREHAETGSLEFRGNKVFFMDESFDQIVICTGIDGGSFNALYDKVPLAPVKGEIILAGMDHQLKDTMVSGGIYVVPVNEGQALVGATYEWNNSDCNPTSAGLEQLTSKLKKIFRSSFTIDAHHAAVRPASPDRKPIAGFLDDNKLIGIMNGFGSKGVLFAPYIAERMQLAIETGQYPDRETDVRRFLS